MSYGYDFTNEEEVKTYLKNIGIEYRFRCYKENNPEGNSLFFFYKADEIFFFYFITPLSCSLKIPFFFSMSFVGNVFRYHQKRYRAG